MKRVILSLILMLTALCVSAQTTFRVGPLEYVNYSGTDVLCTGFADTWFTDITVPATVTYNGTQYTVRRIASNAFTGNTELRRLTIMSTQMETSEYICYSGMHDNFRCYVDIGKYFDVRHSLLKANRKADEAQLLPFVCNPVGRWITLSQVYFWDGNDGLYEKPSISFQDIINKGGKIFEASAQDIQVDNGIGQLELLEIDPKMGLGLPSETGLVAWVEPGKVYKLSRIDEDTYIGSRSLLPTAMTLYEDPYCFPYPINYGTDRDPYTYELDETANTPTFVKVTAKSRTNNPGHAYLSLRNTGVSINDLPAEIQGIYLAPLQPYAELSNDSTTITFYYDQLRYMRSGTTYDLNVYSIWDDDAWGHWYLRPYSLEPSWLKNSIVERVDHVVFDASFKDARPKTTGKWFRGMANLKTITGMKENLNTSEVRFMDFMFSGCSSLESIDVSGFITDSVCSFSSMFEECTSLKSIDVSSFGFYYQEFEVDGQPKTQISNYRDMFYGCSALKTIYDRDREQKRYIDMFSGCTSLVGGAGTVYDENHTNDSYFHIDGGPDNPGYTTLKIRGDVNGDGTVGIGDIVAVTNVMAGIETDPDIKIRANVNDDESVGIGDIVAITNIMAGLE